MTDYYVNYGARVAVKNYVEITNRYGVYTGVYIDLR